MTDSILVLKFGSSVLRTRTDVLAAVQEISRWYLDGALIIAVVSAIGQATEDLLAHARELAHNPEPWATAELLATGERASAALLGIALHRAGIPARVVNPREIALEVVGPPLDGEPAAVNQRRVRELVAAHSVLVVPGFFGTDTHGRTCLLGRGGSDLTAVFLSCSLRARCRLLKDVDGVYESDPADKATHPRRFQELNYDDALRVAGKLVQPKAIEYVKRQQATCEVAALAASYHTTIYCGPTNVAAGAGTVST